MYEQKIQQEQRFEQEQNPQSHWKKILWIVNFLTVTEDTDYGGMR